MFGDFVKIKLSLLSRMAARKLSNLATQSTERQT